MTPRPRLGITTPDWCIFSEAPRYVDSGGDWWTRRLARDRVLRDDLWVDSQRAFLSMTNFTYSGSLTAFSIALTSVATISFGSLGGPITKLVDSHATL